MKPNLKWRGPRPLHSKWLRRVQITKFGPKDDVQIEFKVIRGTGAVAVFTASVDNGSTGQVLRVE